MNDHFLSRWSRRKSAVKAGRPVETDAAPAPAPVIPVETGIQPEAEAAVALPPVESLTPESDFTPFMKAEVDPSLKRAALKTLFSDPRFNVMDGLDVYIDDYSKPDPLPPEWLGQMNQMKYLGEYIEEVPGKDPEKANEEAEPSAVPMKEEPAAFPNEAQPVDTSGQDSTTTQSLNSPPEPV